MPYQGVGKGQVIALEEQAILPEGTRASITPEPSIAVTVPMHAVILKER